MRILIEGIDRLGKTTIAEYIGKKYNLPIIHNVKYKNREQALEIYKEQENIRGVFDRSIMSEDIYGYVFRNESKIDTDVMLNYFKKFDVIIILIDTNNLIEYTCEKDLDFEKIKQCNNLYSVYFNDTKINNFIYINRNIYNTKEKMFKHIDNIMEVFNDLL